VPGYDGTGPRGGGPLTGRGRGYCLMKIPGKPDEPLAGFAGLAGYPVGFPSRDLEADLESLRARILNLRTAVQGLHRRVTAVEYSPSKTSGSTTS